MNYKEYIFSLRFFILAALVVFAFATIQGYFTAQSSPSETEKILVMLQETLGPIVEMPPLNQFLFIVLNNGLTAFLAILLGIIFGIFPFLVLFSNGIILGVLAYFTTATPNFGVGNWSAFLLGTFPHGIIEIPAVILACAIGFKLGKVSFNKLLKKEESIKAELNIALNFFLKVLLPLLILAAAVEIFVTARLL